MPTDRVRIFPNLMFDETNWQTRFCLYSYVHVCITFKCFFSRSVLSYILAWCDTRAIAHAVSANRLEKCCLHDCLLQSVNHDIQSQKRNSEPSIFSRTWQILNHGLIRYCGELSPCPQFVGEHACPCATMQTDKHDLKTKWENKHMRWHIYEHEVTQLCGTRLIQCNSLNVAVSPPCAFHKTPLGSKTAFFRTWPMCNTSIYGYLTLEAPALQLPPVLLPQLQCHLHYGYV